MLAAVTMAALLWPLLRRSPVAAIADRPAQALREIYRDQLRELDAYLLGGTGRRQPGGRARRGQGAADVRIVIDGMPK
ncbi:hypothetical protein AWV80_14285 [Cupriavidus sp. UYMU48A]|nr:hypothetical protein AWV80_14285 [Cupriavidus sp. UYMU48A]